MLFFEEDDEVLVKTIQDRVNSSYQETVGLSSSRAVRARGCGVDGTVDRVGVIFVPPGTFARAVRARAERGRCPVLVEKELLRAEGAPRSGEGAPRAFHP